MRGADLRNVTSKKSITDGRIIGYERSIVKGSNGRSSCAKNMSNSCSWGQAVSDIVRVCLSLTGDWKNIGGGDTAWRFFGGAVSDSSESE